MKHQKEIHSHKKLRETLIKVGVCASPQDTPRNERLRRVLFGTCISMIVATGACSTGIIAIRFESFESFLYAASDSIALFCDAFVMITGLLCRQQIEQTFSKIEQNYDQCNTERANYIEYIFNTHFYFDFLVKNNKVIKQSEHASRRSQMAVNILVKRVIPGLLCYFLTEIISVTAYIYYRDGGITPEAMHKPYAVL